MPTTMMNHWGKHERHFSLMIAIILSTVLLVAGSTSMAKADWYALRDEPVLISVSGKLSNPAGIRVEIMIDGKQTLLSGDKARDFLNLRNYIRFNDKSRRWHTTEKYKVWKKGKKAGSSRPYHPKPAKSNTTPKGGTVKNKCSCQDWDGNGNYGAVRNGKVLKANIGPYNDCMYWITNWGPCY